MLHDLLTRERTAILAQCEVKVLRFGGALATNAPAPGWSMFYDELVELLMSDAPPELHFASGDHFRDKFTKDYVRMGYTVSEVVHSYSVISESIHEFASRNDYTISTGEQLKISAALDHAIADAVMGFEKELIDSRERRSAERIGVLAHELRNSLQTVTIAFELIERGAIGAQSNTSNALQQSLNRMATLIDTALTDVRLRVEPAVKIESMLVMELLNEVAVTSGYQARMRGISLAMKGPLTELTILCDRQLVVSALANLVQNAIKFTHKGGTVTIWARRNGTRTLIEVHDECGGLPEGRTEELFKPFIQHSQDRSGVGLGLTISRDAVVRSHGAIRVKDLPGHGCVFTIDLPNSESTPAAADPVALKKTQTFQMLNGLGLY